MTSLNDAGTNVTTRDKMTRSSAVGCARPHCRAADKRDFMDFTPERSAVDFYRNYDPMVGLGTAAILFGIFFFITVKSMTHYAIRRVRVARHRRRLLAAAERRRVKKRVLNAASDATPSAPLVVVNNGDTPASYPIGARAPSLSPAGEVKSYSAARLSLGAGAIANAINHIVDESSRS